MPKKLAILLAQINPSVGAIELNANKIINIIQSNQSSHDIIVFPELALTGYPPEDLLLRQALYTRLNDAFNRILEATLNCHVILGHPTCENTVFYNSASVIHHGKCIAVYHKQELPNYSVFDEKRYFTAGNETPCIIDIKGYRTGLCICEDIWHNQPVEQLVQENVQLLLCLNASPFEQTKQEQRERLLQAHAKRGLNIVYVNQIGGQDELVFDGQSMVWNNQGVLCARSKAFEEQLQTVILENNHIHGEITPQLAPEALIYRALVCGLRDYVHKNNFPGVLLGLSGGIDSALTLAIAVDALGASRVHAVLLPSRYTANISNEDALEQIRRMQVSHDILPIEPAFNVLLDSLAPVFSNTVPDVTEENLQARIRGVLLMALSNKSGKMLLTTSNKSEAAVGYTTLYGDMNGGFSVLKDVLKTTVYALARYRNSLSMVIPERVITRAPSAELALNQTDQDTLPDYAILDDIIQFYMNDKLSEHAIIAKGFKPEDVQKVTRLIKRNEYKRRQAAPGVKITSCAFGRDWRYPITSGF